MFCSFVLTNFPTICLFIVSYRCNSSDFYCWSEGNAITCFNGIIRSPFWVIDLHTPFFGFPSEHKPNNIMLCSVPWDVELTCNLHNTKLFSLQYHLLICSKKVWKYWKPSNNIINKNLHVRPLLPTMRTRSVVSRCPRSASCVPRSLHLDFCNQR